MSPHATVKMREDAVQLFHQLVHVCKFIEDVTSIPCNGYNDFFMHGVNLALLAHNLAPDSIPISMIYDRTLSRYEGAGNLPSFRHLDNINLFISVLEELQLPKVFHPECRDVYQGRNLPKLVFCLRALEHMLGYTSHCAVHEQEDPSDSTLTRLVECIQECKLPSFEHIAEVMGSFQINMPGQQNKLGKQLHKQTPVKERIWAIAEKENRVMQRNIGNSSPKPPKPPKPQLVAGFVKNISEEQNNQLTHQNRDECNQSGLSNKETRIPMHDSLAMTSTCSSAQQMQKSAMRTPLMPLVNSSKQPSNMQEWVMQQRQQKLNSKALNLQANTRNELNSKSFPPKKLFEPSKIARENCDYIEPQVHQSIVSEPGSCVSPCKKTQPHQVLHESFVRPSNVLASDEYYPSFHTGAASTVQHRRTLSSPVQFVKPLAPCYRLSSQKIASRSPTLPARQSSHQYVSSSVPSSPLKSTSHRLPASASCDDLSVVVSIGDAARHTSSSSLTVLLGEDDYSHGPIRGDKSVNDFSTFKTASLDDCSKDISTSQQQWLHELVDSVNTKENVNVFDGSLIKSCDEATSLAGESGSIQQCLSRLHCSLQTGTEESTLSVLEELRTCYPALPPLLPHAAPLYHLEMSEAMVDAQCALSLEEVCGGVTLVRAVAVVNTAVRTADARSLHRALTDTAAHMQDVSADLMEEYLAAMRTALDQLAAMNKLAKEGLPVGGMTEEGPALCSLLTYLHIQQIIDQVNTAAEDRMSQLDKGEHLNVSSDEERNATFPVTAENFSCTAASAASTSASPVTSQLQASYSSQASQCSLPLHGDSRSALDCVQSSNSDRISQSTFAQDIFSSLSKDFASTLSKDVPQSSQAKLTQDRVGSLEHSYDSGGEVQQPDDQDKSESYVNSISIDGSSKDEDDSQLGGPDTLVVRDSRTVLSAMQEQAEEVSNNLSRAKNVMIYEQIQFGATHGLVNERSNVLANSINCNKSLEEGSFLPISQRFAVNDPQLETSKEILENSRMKENQKQRESFNFSQEFLNSSHISGHQQVHVHQQQQSNLYCEAKQQIPYNSVHMHHQEVSNIPTESSYSHTQAVEYQPSRHQQEVQPLYDHLRADLDLSGTALSYTGAGESASYKSTNACRRASSTTKMNEVQKRNWTTREVHAAARLQRWWRLQLALSRLRHHLRNKNATVDGSTAVTVPWGGRASTTALLQVLAPCLTLLPLTMADLRTEKELQAVRSGVSRCLRITAQLQKEVDHLDLQIGLLLTNTMTIQDPSLSPFTAEEVPCPVTCGHDGSLVPLACVTPAPSCKKTGGGLPERRGTLSGASGLKALRKCSRERLQGYQQLFYLLQTQPRYLATLIFALPSANTTRFVEGVVLSLFNYGANDRDNFLLINLFKTALEEEIRCKVLHLSDIVSGEPLVVKMIVSFVRKGPGRAALREVLGPLVTQVLEDKNLNLNTNPVEIYQTWLNEIEMETGRSSGHPYHVTVEAALQHQAVVSRLQATLAALTSLTSDFCAAIASSLHRLPYALLYLAGVMRRALANRFPHIPDKEIVKVVGSLIYYRYINSGLVAPDAFDVVNVGPEQQLNSRQRRNLATIAKTLQAAATKRGFGVDTPHLCSLNPHLVSWHESLRQFFLQCCRVPAPDAVFAVTQYSEAALIHRPQIHVTLQELYDTHCLVLSQRAVLAPSPSDPLHAVLDDLPAPDLAAMGDSSGKTEVCLTLCNKFDFTETETEEETNSSKDAHAKLFERSKQLVVDVLLCHVTSRTYEWQDVTLQALVNTCTEPLQENRYRAFKTTCTEGSCDSLHAAKTRLSHNLRRLQTLGLASPVDGYQALLQAVAEDVLSQHSYRANRSKELSRLSLALSQLQQKEQFMREQRDSFLTYLTTCRANMMQHWSRRHRRGSGSGLAVTYSGKRLMEKGVLVNIRDFTPSQYSSVAFVIARVDPVLYSDAKAKPCSEPQQPSSSVGEEADNCNNSSQAEPATSSVMNVGGGVFSVTVKYRGVVVDTVRISIQELLHLQYEGVRVKQVAGGAQINVNLLLHLVNTKFFTKKK